MIIASGSKATAPPVKGLKETGYLTHVEALKLQQLPEKLIIIGAGPVGIELAQMFARFGSKVTIMKRSPGVLRFTEPELTQRLAQVLSAEGIEIFTADVIDRARRNPGPRRTILRQEPKKYYWGTEAFIADPNGYIWAIID